MKLRIISHACLCELRDIYYRRYKATQMTLTRFSRYGVDEFSLTGI